MPRHTRVIDIEFRRARPAGAIMERIAELSAVIIGPAVIPVAG